MGNRVSKSAGTVEEPSLGARLSNSELATIPLPPYATPKILRWAYCTKCVSGALARLPYWAQQYRHASSRPRASWSLPETLLVRFTRHVGAMTEEAGHQHATRDPRATPHDADHLKETTFRWVPNELERFGLMTGVLDDKSMRPLDQVGTFVWSDGEEDFSEGGKDEFDSEPDQWVGIYLHGGGYTHFSAHEKSQTSQIPRRLMATGRFSSIHAVEYRLLPKGSFPAALQDVATVYAHLTKSLRIPSKKIVIIGDSAGGNAALAVARMIRDEETLEKPGGLLLLSPWCDPSHCFPCTASSLIPRPNAPTDYLRDSPSARRLLVRTFLGHHPHSFVESPYISPASPLGPHGTFVNFPKTFINYGDAERLEEEIDMLVTGMRRDGVDLDVEKTRDAPHDVLMIQFWNEQVRAGIYARIEEWLDAGRVHSPQASKTGLRSPGSSAENLI